MYRMLWLALSVLVPINSGAVEIYDRFPDNIRASERYVIYSHGMIVEGDDPKPISPKYGQYDFPAIKQSLFSEGGFNLIAYQRPKNSDDTYVDTLKLWVRRLLDAGVKQHRITLVGFSRGAHGSCGQLAARSHLTSFKEVPISTGKMHGAFFQPLPDWIAPLKAWIARTNR
jgi:hypothetical protein